MTSEHVFQSGNRCANGKHRKRIDERSGRPRATAAGDDISDHCHEGCKFKLGDQEAR